MSKLAYDRREAAEACSVSEDTIKKAVASGALRAKRSGRKDDKADGDGVGKYLITHDALLAWLEGLADA